MFVNTFESLPSSSVAVLLPEKHEETETVHCREVDSPAPSETDVTVLYGSPETVNPELGFILYEVEIAAPGFVSVTLVVMDR